MSSSTIRLATLLLPALSLSLLPTDAGADAPRWPDLGQVRHVGGGEKDVALIASVEKSVFVQGIPGANANAELWYSYLTDGRGTPADRIKLLRDAQVTNSRLLKEAREIAQQAQPGSTLWFVFVGHGATAPDGKDGLLVGADVQQDADSLVERSVRRGEILELLSHSRAERVVAVIDACFSGRNHQGAPLIPGLQPLVVQHRAKAVPPKVVVLSASESTEFAGPLPGADRPAFSYLALGALRGWGSRTPTGDVTASDVQAYAAKALRATAHDRTQTPTLEGRPQVVLGRGWEQGPPLDLLARGPTAIHATAIDAAPTAPAPAPPAPALMPAPRPDEAHVTFVGQTGAIVELRGPGGPVVRGRIPFTATVPPGDVLVRIAATGLQAREMSLRLGAEESRSVNVVLPPAGDAGAQWIRFAGVRYTRGNNEGEPDERPARLVTVAPFDLLRHEVTVGQYKACVRAGGCNQHNLSGIELGGESYREDDRCNWPTPNFDLHPINCVDHEQARAFCGWIGARLPTEAEWELAARGTEGRAYPWGDETPSCQRAVLNDGSPGCGNGGTAPVCSHPLGSTPNGVCDLAGNVWEWVADVYSATGYGDGEVAEPWGPGAGSTRVRRGGGYSDSPDYLRATNRWSLGPGYRSPGLGFRCARSNVAVGR